MRRATLVAAVLVATACSDPPAQRGPVTVTVLEGGPVAGAVVVYQDPDGTVVAEAVTDGAGRATGIVGRGGSVTVGRFQPGTTDLWIVDTVAEVAPGAALVLDPTDVLSGGALAGQAQVTFPGAFEGATQYMANLGCTGTSWSSTPDPASPFLSTLCGPTVDAIAEARDGQGLVAWSAVTGVPLAGAVPDQAAEVLFGPWRSDLLAVQLTATNPPAEGGSLYATYTPSRNGVPFVQSGMAGAASLAPPQPATVSFAAARDFWTSAQLFLSVDREDGRRGLMENGVTVASRVLDLGAILPPRLSGLALAPSAGGTAVRWTQAGPFGGQDGTILMSDWTGPRGRLLWRVLLPPGRTSLDLPALPAAAAEFGPAGGAAMSWAGMTSYDASAPASTFRELQAAYGPLVEGAPMRGPASIRFTSTLLVP